MPARRSRRARPRSAPDVGRLLSERSIVGVAGVGDEVAVAGALTFEGGVGVAEQDVGVDMAPVAVDRSLEQGDGFPDGRRIVRRQTVGGECDARQGGARMALDGGT